MQAGDLSTVVHRVRTESRQKASAMVIKVDPELEAVLNALARQQGTAPDVLALNALRERFLAGPSIVPKDEWERALLGVGTNCGVSLPHSALGSEGLYE
jgi:predicted transcriptional regulator